ncbi:MAG TPA: S-formylglutathione hydrolase [Bacteriovoracaceae bacterium]|nr:S-formylglutathione hydrolase [Bacteriovoracaceae bacterium]
MNLIKGHKTFNGVTRFWSHQSKITKTEMKFSTFIPENPQGAIIWLSGLTCNEENFITKAGAQKYLSEHNLMVICPDTSPRGLNLPGEHDSYDFGSGAGFYVNATTDDYKNNYLMDDYIMKEIVPMLKNDFKMERISITGHSMGGHGALVLGLRNPEVFSSISAFSPIVHPSQCPWGEKAFTGYLGSNKADWAKYDATELVKAGHKHPKNILIHQGTHDEFLTRELLTTDFIDACVEMEQEQEVVFCDEYDHSYYFISTFIESHILHHKKFL